VIVSSYRAALGRQVGFLPLLAPFVFLLLTALSPQPRTRDFIVQWDGPGCIDTIRWHWGAGEPDDETAIENPTDQDECLRSFHRRHTFSSGARRQVWVTFLRHGEEMGQSTPEWVSP
jgi:hypothetical protein